MRFVTKFHCRSLSQIALPIIWIDFSRFHKY